MSNNRDYFDDVPEAQQAQFGSLGGEGSAALEQTRTKVTPSGIETHCSCGQCGTPNIVTVEWKEAVVGSQAAVPEGWKVNREQGALSPFIDTMCRSCGYWLELLFTPAELDRYVNTAVNQGILNGQAVASTKASVRAEMQQGRQPPPQQQMYRRGP